MEEKEKPTREAGNKKQRFEKKDSKKISRESFDRTFNKQRKEVSEQFHLLQAEIMNFISVNLNENRLLTENGLKGVKVLIYEWADYAHRMKRDPKVVVQVDPLGMKRWITEFFYQREYTVKMTAAVQFLDAYGYSRSIVKEIEKNIHDDMKDLSWEELATKGYKTGFEYTEEYIKKFNPEYYFVYKKKKMP